MKRLTSSYSFLHKPISSTASSMIIKYTRLTSKSLMRRWRLLVCMVVGNLLVSLTVMAVVLHWNHEEQYDGSISNIHLHSKDPLNDERMVNNENVPLSNGGRLEGSETVLDNLDVILVWNKIFTTRPYKLDPNSNQLQRPPQCFARYPRCVMTTNRRYLAKATAVIVHWPCIPPSELPDQNKLDRSNQTWILYTIESPSWYFLNRKFNFNFNLTATYRSDSDLPLPYGQIRTRVVALEDDDERVQPSLEHKNKMVVWFVSNCLTYSKRENYVAELVKWIPVDIYGRCSGIPCGNRGASECYHMAAQKYYFYLSFENSLCTEYVTEKLFNVLQYGMVPVVYGGANYSRLLPPHSYIDATHLHPRDLATKLMAVANDPQEYRKYFLWKKTHYVSSWFSSEDHVFCSVCKWIDEERKKKKNGLVRTVQSKTPEQLNQWFGEKSNCFEPVFKFNESIFPGFHEY